MALRHFCFGGGVDSTAALILAAETGVEIEAITMADTGDERAKVYEHTERFSRWCEERGLPPITMVRRTRRDGRWLSLSDECFEKQMLPSLAYGFKTCSQKYKAEAQNKWCNNHPPYKAAWKRGEKVIKCIGYDYDEIFRAKIGEDKKYTFEHPLIDARWRRNVAVAVCRRRLGYVPAKSSCFMCPSMKKHEIEALRDEAPELFERALAMERNANLRTVKGLGRRFSWADLAKATDEPDIACGCYDG